MKPVGSARPVYGKGLKSYLNSKGSRELRKGLRAPNVGILARNQQPGKELEPLDSQDAKLGLVKSHYRSARGDLFRRSEKTAQVWSQVRSLAELKDSFMNSRSARLSSGGGKGRGKLLGAIACAIRCTIKCVKSVSLLNF